MERFAVRKVKDLQAAAKRWVESLLGRQLQGEDQVAVLVFPSQPALPDAAREEAWDRLEQVMDKMAEKANDIPDDELEELLNETMEHVRRREP